MSNNAQWSEWNLHDGAENPLEDWVLTKVKLRSGSPCSPLESPSKKWRWDHDGTNGDIVEYSYQLDMDDNTETEGEREAWQKIERDQHNYRQSQQLCIEQAAESD